MPSTQICRRQQQINSNIFNMLRPPTKQTATDTINTLSSRLSTATLLEDRRAAILGLRSFAKLYPASVASGALRDLLAGLRRDGEDPDTLKIVLETLFMLFEPDPKSPEASDDIPLWLADEFTQRQDNITALLDLLDTGEFYLRLYSLQILSQVCAARPQRTQEAMFTAPLGVSRITAVLDDKREAVQNEALLLLVALTPTSAELQKVVAFENAFDRVFTLIDGEGGLTHGATTVQDCLSLLGNLLNLNTSNQAYFREIGCVGKVSRLLAQVIKEEESPDGVSEWARPQRDINLWGLLTVLQLFLTKGSQGTPQSQDAFWKSGVVQRVLQIAFHQTFAPNVRARALDTCAAMIRANKGLQELFGDLAVPAVRPAPVIVNGRATPKASSVKSGTSTPSQVEMSNVIESLLELTLETTAAPSFDVRLAACNCVKAFFDGHNGIRGHVLRRAIEGHRSGDDAVPNILTVLLEPPNTRANADPYQQWMAAVLLLHLLLDHPESKELALKVSEAETEAESEDGYEVVTFVQSITSNVVAGVQHPEDERALIGYLMLLSTWLFEDPNAVNDLLGEGSTIQGLISAVKVSSPTMPLVAGLCTFLLGIVYEFSTKDSPIPRATLHAVITKSLSREIYIDKLTKLRESPFLRDFEVLPLTSDSGLPDVYFEQTFVDFFKDNFSRFLRAIDREPGFEVSILTNGVQKGVSRELVDSLRSELDQHKSSLETTQSELTALRQKFEQEQLEHKRTRDSTTVELTRIKHINQSLQSGHEDELKKLQSDLARQTTTIASSHESTLLQLRKEHAVAIEQASRQAKIEKEYLEQRRNALEKEVAKQKENVSRIQAEFEKSTAQGRHIQAEQQSEIDALHEQLKTFQDQLSVARNESEEKLAALKKDHDTKLSEATARADNAEKTITTAKTSLQNELKALHTKLSEAESGKSKAEISLKKAEEDLKKLTSQQTSSQKQEKNSAAELEKSKAENEKMKVELEKAKTEMAKMRKQLEEVNKELKNKESKGKKKSTVEIEKKELEELKANAAKQKDTQSELDDLLIVYAELDAKRAGEKKKLKELGQVVSDDEDEEEDEEDGDDDDVD